MKNTFAIEFLNKDEDLEVWHIYPSGDIEEFPSDSTTDDRRWTYDDTIGQISVLINEEPKIGHTVRWYQRFGEIDNIEVALKDTREDPMAVYNDLETVYRKWLKDCKKLKK